MAEIWAPTRRKRFLLNALDLAVRFVPGLAGAGSRRDPPRPACEVRTILVVELWNIGDVILTLPFLAQLRAIFPIARVTLLGRAHAKDILAGTGLVYDFIETDLGWTAATAGRNPWGYHWRELFRALREIRARRFDLAFQARRHVREHFLLGMSLADRKIGLSMSASGGALSDSISQTSSIHKTDDWLSLLVPFGGPVECGTPRLAISDKEREWASDYLASQGVVLSSTLVGVHPGASVPEKRWPLGRFEEVLRALQAQSGVKIISFTDPAGYGSSLGRIAGVVDARVSLRQMMALIAHCRFLVCNDSGPMHVAGALGVPTVGVFAPGIAKWFSPLGDGHETVVANPAQHSPSTPRANGIEAVTPAMVLAAIARVRERPFPANASRPAKERS